MITDTALRLGRFPGSGEEYLFDVNESLMTIARPGRGKSQAMVIRNLLYLKGPAFVLDVKPEIHQATAAWRDAEVGPVIYYNPADIAGSVCFNPLDFVPDDPAGAFRFILNLVALLVVTPNAVKFNDFWESRAAQFLTAAIYDVAMHDPFGRRDMTSVVRWFSPSDEEAEDIIERLADADVQVMRNLSNTMRNMQPKMRENIFETARRHIEPWSYPGLEQLGFRTTFDLTNLRRDNATFYLCVTPEDLVSYATVIRTIIGLIYLHMRTAQDDWVLPPVTFFLDEFPQLGYLREIEKMMETGRQAGLRLWLFAQTMGQIRKIYGGDDEGFSEMVAVRSYMEPTGRLAEELSRELGKIPAGFYGKERPRATPQQLAGPEFVDKVLIIQGGKKFALLNRVMAFSDPGLTDRYPSPKLASP
ncbi:hypothetical protein NS226_13615 [Aureimonas ureilytica]|uniref:Conjugal transfer protein TraG n=1 Tax=Aureimonas ureilytica TaxID=401562 RepID=A0A175R6C1_9HYPH|nr:type IV secretory system conjugative DNA transfer family protein [Aureimonas ureilytica]KTQ95030.1 hypothetical protein NS226_13615 [Aureimonas ureilytica]